MLEPIVILGLLLVVAVGWWTFQIGKIYVNQNSSSWETVKVASAIVAPQIMAVVSLGLLVVVLVLAVDPCAKLAEKIWPGNIGNDGAHSLKGFLWWIGAVVVFAVVFGLIAYDHSRPDGQPFDVHYGVSVWPPTLIRLATVVLGVIFLSWGWQRLQDNQRQLEKEFIGYPQRAEPSQVKGLRRQIIKACRADLSDPTAPHGADHVSLCQNYFELGSKGNRCRRAFLWTFTILVGTWAFLLVTDTQPDLSYRGWSTFLVASPVLQLAVFAVVFVIMLTVDAFVLCRRFVDDLAKDGRDWREVGCKLRKEQAGLRNWGPLEGQYPDVRRPDALDELVTVRFIALHTRAIGKLIWFPLILLTMLLFARHHWLDNTYLPLTLMVAIGLLVVALVFAAYRLRRVAARARERILDRVDEHHSDAQADATNPHRKEQIRIIIDHVHGEKQGAFGPISDDPLLTSLLVPFGSVSGLLLLERLLSQ